MDEQAEDLAVVLATVVDNRSHVVGHFYGTFLALFITMGHLERIRSLVLAEPAVVLLLDECPGHGRTFECPQDEKWVISHALFDIKRARRS